MSVVLQIMNIVRHLMPIVCQITGVVSHFCTTSGLQGHALYALQWPEGLGDNAIISRTLLQVI